MDKPIVSVVIMKMDIIKVDGDAKSILAVIHEE